MVYSEHVFGKQLRDIDPVIAGLVEYEEARQANKIILIPSESICPRPILEALGSSFNNLYAEGYPSSFMAGEEESRLIDIDFQLTRYRRYADRRFYKGCEYADLVEMIAARRAAELFQTKKNPPENIFVNVQPLSGSIAISAVYDAFVRPGETVMGMSLMHGGHLSHGSEFNRSGKLYSIVSYEVDTASGRLDYSKIIERARELKPRMIIAGFTSYPWAPDWKKFRKAADGAGAILLADISHPAGMVAAGVHPNPVDYADVVVFTTHKTLFGPRGAVIMTTNREYAQRIEQAVFPGEQGGPHVNKFAAMAAAFRIAKSDGFRKVQRSIVENARFLGDVLKQNGLTLAYGGTDTHLLMIDLSTIESRSGFPLKGEIAVRILDLCGIVANKNTIPGDTETGQASGVRIGTPWITQRGITRQGLEELGSVIAETLKNIHPFSYRGLIGDLPRGKIDLNLLVDIQSRVRLLEQSMVREKAVSEPCYPHYGFGCNTVSGDTASVDAVYITGARAGLFMDRVCTRLMSTCSPGETCEAFLLGEKGRLITQVTVHRLPSENGNDRFLLMCPAETVEKTVIWLRALSDGYVLFDPNDIFRKIDGPVVVRRSDECGGEIRREIDSIAASDHRTGTDKNQTPEPPGTPAADLYSKHPEFFDISKPYFVGCHALDLRMKNPEKPVFRLHEWKNNGSGDRANSGFPGSRPSVLYDEHIQLGAHMVEFAGWRMPLRYERIIDEHRAVRHQAGLFDISHMGVFDVRGDFATRFLDAVCTNYVPWIHPGQSMYGYLLDAEGNTIDDVMIYKIAEEGYIIVVNSANADIDFQWLSAVNEGTVRIDNDVPVRTVPGRVVIRDLKDGKAAGSDALVGIALQGPVSLKTLCRLASSDDSGRIRRIEKSEFIQCEIGGYAVLAARTGYTGEELGYEILVHPDEAPLLWNKILDAGRREGVKPTGLGARDSLRIEAGLPLHGHELAGQWNIDPIEAGFGPYVKFHKIFFTGREALLLRSRRSSMTIARFKMDKRGLRMAKTGDYVVESRSQKIIGRVTSCALGEDEVQVGLAHIDARVSREGTRVGIVGAFSGNEKTISVKLGERYNLPVDAQIVSRFPEKG